MKMFFKDLDPVMGLLDGFDSNAGYQMVPLNRSRVGFRITTREQAVDVSFEPPGHAVFSGQRTFQPPTATPINGDRMRLGPKTIATFDVFGKSAGRTLLVIRRASDGQAIESFTFSVKAPRPKTYSICVVSDRRRRSPWLPTHDPTSPAPPPAADSLVRPLMETVKRCFVHQANVELSDPTGRLHDLSLNDIDLGDPIVLNKGISVLGVRKPASSWIIDRTPIAAKSADFTIYLCWSIRELTREIVGLNIGKACFIEFNTRDQNENMLTIAHELGHGLGLGHNGRDVLMAGDGISRSELLNQFEIDTVNTSGTEPDTDTGRAG